MKSLTKILIVALVGLLLLVGSLAMAYGWAARLPLVLVYMVQLAVLLAIGVFALNVEQIVKSTVVLTMYYFTMLGLFFYVALAGLWGVRDFTFGMLWVISSLVVIGLSIYRSGGVLQRRGGNTSNLVALGVVIAGLVAVVQLATSV